MLVLLLAGVAGCSSDDVYLPALLADPMADCEATGIELIVAREQGEGRSLLTDKPIYAQVERRYRIVDQDQVDQALSDAVAFAESQGWRMQQDITVATLFLGAKRMDPGDGRLSVALAAVDPVNDPDGPHVLRIHLDFGPGL